MARLVNNEKPAAEFIGRRSDESLMRARRFDVAACEDQHPPAK
jgi:hypothetical protein